MNLSKVAQMIPAEYRDQILESNAIYKAIAIPADPHMSMLFIVWTTFVNPGSGLDMDCSICLGEILGYYKTIQSALLEARQIDQLSQL